MVLTVGEKIGRQGMTYAQGVSAQVTAVAAIGMANVFALPVSTTHVLSSGVAGTMVANRSGLQGSTVRNILMAWVLTLPASMALSAGLSGWRTCSCDPRRPGAASAAPGRTPRRESLNRIAIDESSEMCPSRDTFPRQPYGERQ